MTDGCCAEVVLRPQAGRILVENAWTCAIARLVLLLLFSVYLVFGRARRIHFYGGGSKSLTGIDRWRGLDSKLNEL